MKICFLADAGSVHTQKWCRYFSGRGHEVHVISFVNHDIENTCVHYIDSGATRSDADVKKLCYLMRAGEVRRLIQEIQPDIVNAHYASSYGTVAALAGLKHHVVSVWGSDIYEFPQKSFFHKILLSFAVNRAGFLFSTSQAMAIEASKYTKKPFTITPFGVDMELFSPAKRNRTDEAFVIGTVKGLKCIYGIDDLLRAAGIVHKKRSEIPLCIRIAGSGPDESAFRSLAVVCGVAEITTWLGFITQEQAAREWANMDLAVIPSLMESFGVAAVEAQACETPVIISDVPGLMEATNPGVSSLVIPKKDPEALANAIISLYEQPEKRREMGKAGRRYMLEHYELDRCFQDVETLFEKLRAEAQKDCPK